MFRFAAEVRFQFAALNQNLILVYLFALKNASKLQLAIRVNIFNWRLDTVTQHLLCQLKKWNEKFRTKSSPLDFFLSLEKGPHTK